MPLSTGARTSRSSRSFLSARDRATKPPVILAVRVPPSACSTSQSTQIVRSPSAVRSTMLRRARPISRWISCVRPEGRPRVISRCERVSVAAGIIAYSPVTQPSPVWCRKGGTRSSILAVQRTRVSPISTSTDPGGCLRKPGVSLIGRNSSSVLPSCLFVLMAPTSRSGPGYTFGRRESSLRRPGAVRCGR
jgi:hypothetical protein